MNKYLLNGSLTAKEGHGEALANILVEASALVSTAKGCIKYVVAIDKNDANTVYITEIWDSKADHDASLNVPGVKELIMQAMPILSGQPMKGQELEIIGGA